jgi:hypothetical protein
MLTDALDYLKADLIATVLAPGMSGLDDVRQRPDMLAAARRAGREALDRIG